MLRLNKLDRVCAYAHSRADCAAAGLFVFGAAIMLYITAPAATMLSGNRKSEQTINSTKYLKLTILI